jgi:hypothetical protein
MRNILQRVLVVTPSIYLLDDPSSYLNKFPTKPSKTIGPPGKLEGNTSHKMYYVVSPEIVLWVTSMLIFLQYRKYGDMGFQFISLCIDLVVLSIILNILSSANFMHAI